MAFVLPLPVEPRLGARKGIQPVDYLQQQSPRILLIRLRGNNHHCLRKTRTASVNS
jgi:hypothetical protein